MLRLHGRSVSAVVFVNWPLRIIENGTLQRERRGGSGGGGGGGGVGVEEARTSGPSHQERLSARARETSLRNLINLREPIQG